MPFSLCYMTVFNLTNLVHRWKLSLAIKLFCRPFALQLTKICASQAQTIIAFGGMEPMYINSSFLQKAAPLCFPESSWSWEKQWRRATSACGWLREANFRSWRATQTLQKWSPRRLDPSLRCSSTETLSSTRRTGHQSGGQAPMAILVPGWY